MYYNGYDPNSGLLTCLKGFFLAIITSLLNLRMLLLQCDNISPGPCFSLPCGVGKCSDSGHGKYNCTCPKSYYSGPDPATGKLTCLEGTSCFRIVNFLSANLPEKWGLQGHALPNLVVSGNVRIVEKDSIIVPVLESTLPG